MSSVSQGGVGTHALLTPDGPLAEPERLADLRRAIEESLEAERTRIAVDLSAVPVVGSSALELFKDALYGAERGGCHFELTHVSAAVEGVLHLVGMAGDLLATPRLDASALAPSKGRSDRRIGEILLERGLVDEEQIEEALALQRETGRRMADQMVEKGFITERDLLHALGEQLGLPYCELSEGFYDPIAVRSIHADVARRLDVVPLFQIGDVLFLATTDPQSLPALETVEDLTECKVRLVLSPREAIHETIASAWAQGTDLSEYIADFDGDLEVVERQELEDHSAIDEQAEGSPVINLINGLIQRAIRDLASDIHIEPLRNRCRVRFRVDGVLYRVMSPPLDVHPALVSRLKVMAKLDIAERRLPQDGRIQVVSGGRTIDLRFSSLPGIFGEKIVLRVLDKNQSILDIDHLGFHEHNRSHFLRLLDQSNGLIMVTGPTGSGKTTTLYAAMNMLNNEERNIVTIEDPVEYQIDGLTQNQVRDSIGLSFARVLKHVLRQDPDVIMVGEIRERETAEIAVQAALTGHLVLSTLHTNDGVGAVIRMLDMGVEPFLLSSALAGVVAQRLIRRVCTECRSEFVAPEALLAEHGLSERGRLRLVRGRGCPSCYDSGYKGRMAIHEVLPNTSALQRLIVSNPSREDLDRYLAEEEVRTLREDGLERAIAGDTTVEEVLRVVNQ